MVRLPVGIRVLKRSTGFLSRVQIARRNGESRSEEPERGAGNELTFPFSIQEDIEEKSVPPLEGYVSVKIRPEVVSYLSIQSELTHNSCLEFYCLVTENLKVQPRHSAA